MFERFFARIGHFFVEKAKTAILIVSILTIILAIGITRIQIDMGYEMMVSPNSEVYKDTEIFEDNFGGDGIYLLLSGKPEDLITQEMLQKITTFTEEVKKMPEITGSIDFISLMNEILNSDISISMSDFDLSNSDLLKVLEDEFSEENIIEVQEEMQKNLSEEQIEKIGTYTQSLLTKEQQLEMSELLSKSTEAPTEEQQSKLMQSVLTEE